MSEESSRRPQFSSYQHFILTVRYIYIYIFIYIHSIDDIWVIGYCDNADSECSREADSHNMEEELSEKVQYLKIIYKQHISYILLVEVQEEVSSVSVWQEKRNLPLKHRSTTERLFIFHLWQKDSKITSSSHFIWCWRVAAETSQDTIWPSALNCSVTDVYTCVVLILLQKYALIKVVKMNVLIAVVSVWTHAESWQLLTSLSSSGSVDRRLLTINQQKSLGTGRINRLCAAGGGWYVVWRTEECVVMSAVPLFVSLQTV